MLYFLKNGGGVMLTTNQELLLYEVKKVYEENGVTPKIDKIIDLAIRRKNLELCYRLALLIKEPTYTRMFELFFLDCKNPMYCRKFACSFKGIDIKPFQQIVLAGKNPKDCYLFALYVQGADVRALQKVVEKSKSVRYIKKFLYHVKDANESSLCRCIIEFGSVQDNLEVKRAMPQMYEVGKKLHNGELIPFEDVEPFLR